MSELNQEESRPSRWPVVIAVTIALCFWAVRNFGQIDWQAVQAGNTESAARGAGSAFAYVLLGIIVGVIYRKTLGRPKPPTDVS
jgi:hypothetical protein